MLKVAGVLAVVAVNAAYGTLVDVGNTKYLGTALPNGISQWLGIRYGAPPVGDLRFRAPVDPPVNDTIQVANQHGPLCYSTGAGYPQAGLRSEDCLFLDVFAPTNATSKSKLPVFFWVQGGGFNNLANANFNGSELIKAADYDIIVVTHNYRVGPYGFLASKEVQKNGDTNVGLLDQRKALEWVQRHISKFGGNPEHVVLGGPSAGAQALTLHLTAYGGAPTNLYHAAVGQSQSFPPILTVEQSQFQYDALVERVGCANSTDSLGCLRALDISVLQSSNIAIPLPGRTKLPAFLYTAAVDGSFLPDIPYRLFREGKFVKVPSIFGHVTDEGTLFTPANISSYSELDDFLLDNFPKLNESSLRTIHHLYPKGEQFPDHGAYYSAAAQAYGELRYTCPGFFISNWIKKYRRPRPNWFYHYDVEDPTQAAAGLGVPHIVETVAIWGLNSTAATVPPASYFTTNHNIVPIVQGYWTSFIRSLNPNRYRAPGSPKWEPYDAKRSLLFQTNNTRIAKIPWDLKKRCAFLISLGEELDQ